MEDNQQRLIIILGVILVLVAAGAAGVLYLLPVPGFFPGASEQLPLASPSEFNLQVLDRTVYQGLDQRLIQSGQLPVKPPVGAGKANPFL